MSKKDLGKLSFLVMVAGLVAIMIVAIVLLFVSPGVAPAVSALATIGWLLLAALWALYMELRRVIKKHRSYSRS